MFGAIARPVPASALHVCDALLHQVTHPQALGNEAQHSPSQQRVANLVPSCPPPRYMRISAPLPVSSQPRSTSPESCPLLPPEHDDAPRRRATLTSLLNKRQNSIQTRSSGSIKACRISSASSVARRSSQHCERVR